MNRAFLLHSEFIRRAGIVLVAGGVALAAAGCDSDTGRMPRANSGAATDSSRQAPGSQVGSTSAPAGPYAAGTSSSSTPQPSPSDATNSTPQGTASATPSAQSSGSTSSPGSDLSEREKSSALPQPKQNNDHSTPPTVRGQIGNDGQTYPSGSNAPQSGVAPRG